MAMDAEIALREALAAHLATEGLPDDAGTEARWVKTKIGPIPFAYPNTRRRKKILLAHDLHHLLAGYGTDIAGEAEMAAWELGSGTTDRTAVRYAIRVFGFGLPWFPRRLMRAFVRGRHCEDLLDRSLTDGTLDRSVAALRSDLRLDRPVPAATTDDHRVFRRWAAKSIAIVWGPLVPMAAVAWWWLQ